MSVCVLSVRSDLHGLEILNGRLLQLVLEREQTRVQHYHEK